MKIKIATNSIEKINGIKLAISRFFQIRESEIEILHNSVDSGVPRQPFNEETYIGAKNRVKSIIDSDDVDFYISCEAGIEEINGYFFNVQVVCIYSKKYQKYSFGKSSGWEVPKQDIDIIRSSSIDVYLKKQGILCLEELIGRSRSEEVLQATVNALSVFKLY